MTDERKRAHITSREEGEIKRYATSPMYRDMKRVDLAEKLLIWIKWPGKPPEREVLEKKITEYRRPGDVGEDAPWSLGESMKAESRIPPEATAILLELWRYSLEIGYPLTLRHAKWIARLCSVIVNAGDGADHWKQIQVLFFAALRYADLERISQVSRVTLFDTRAEDADLVLSPDEAAMMRIAGILPVPQIVGIPKREEKRDRVAAIRRSTRAALYEIVRTGDFNVVMIAHYLHQPWSLDQLPHPKDNKESLKLYRAWLDIEDKVAGLSIEQQRAYAILVTCFSKGPKWNELSPKDFLDIIGGFAELTSQQSRLGQILGPVLLDEGHAFAPYFKKVGLTPAIDMDMDVETISSLYGGEWRKDSSGMLAPCLAAKDSKVKRERHDNAERRQ